VIRGRPVSSLEHWDAAHGLTINSRPPRGRVGVLTGHIGRCRPTDVDRELSFLILKLDGAGWMAPEILAAPTMSKESTMTTQTGTQGGHEFVPAEHTPADGDAPRRALALAQIRWRSTNLAVSKQRFLAESVQLIADALEVPLVKVLELERSGKWLVVRAGVGWSAGIVGRAKVPVGTTSHAGLTICTDTPVIYDDLPHLAWFLRIGGPAPAARCERDERRHRRGGTARRSAHRTPHAPAHVHTGRGEVPAAGRGVDQ
jgi:hypothetical protein